MKTLGLLLLRGKNTFYYEETQLYFLEDNIMNREVYLVYRMTTLCGEEYGPELQRIFDREKKVIEYVENELKDYDYHRDSFGIY